MNNISLTVVITIATIAFFLIMKKIKSANQRAREEELRHELIIAVIKHPLKAAIRIGYIRNEYGLSREWLLQYLNGYEYSQRWMEARDLHMRGIYQVLFQCVRDYIISNDSTHLRTLKEEAEKAANCRLNLTNSEFSEIKSGDEKIRFCANYNISLLCLEESIKQKKPILLFVPSDSDGTRKEVIFVPLLKFGEMLALVESQKEKII